MIQRLRMPLTLAALLCASVFSQAASLPLLTRHTRDVTSNGKSPMVGRLPENQTMRLVVALPLRNEADLDKFLEDLYDENSASYQQYLTVEQFTEKYGPTRADYEAVKDWARSNGFEVVKTSRNRVNVDVVGKVSNIEKALHVTMGVYQHDSESRTFYAPDREPSADLSVQLWHVSGLDNYSIPRSALHKLPAGVVPPATTGSCPSASFCGSDMRAAYYGGTAETGAGQYVGLLEYLGTDLADLNTYYKNVKQTLNVTPKLTSVDGTSTSCLAAAGCDDTEQTLDMTQALGMAPNLSGLTMYIGSTDAAILNGIATDTTLTHTIGCSWEWRPPDPTTDDPYFKQMATQGQTFFVAAGDSGDWQLGTVFWYPADDAYVVSVGGTDLTTASAGGAWASETVWSSGGGGHSPTPINIPSWQVATAKGCSSCSQTVRNGPDVAANSNFTFYVCADQTSCTANLYGGTSFATPMWAGYIALVNEFHVAHGGKPLGFINPHLYKIGLNTTAYAHDFHDITSGSNGYSATTGYDLATGWGSPKAGGLVK